MRALLVVHVKTETKGGPHSGLTREDVRVFLFFNDLSVPTEKQQRVGTEGEGDVTLSTSKGRNLPDFC